MKNQYTYNELEREYCPLNRHLPKKSSNYLLNLIKNNFLIEREVPITAFEVNFLIAQITKTLDTFDDRTFLELPSRSLKLFDVFMADRTDSDYFDELKKVKFPFGLREFVHLEVPKNKGEQGVLTDFFTFTERVKRHLIKYMREQYHGDRFLDEKDCFTSYFTASGQEKGWIYPVSAVYKRLTKKKFDPLLTIDDEALKESIILILNAALKMSYSGFIKEHYTKAVILTHPKVINNEVAVYRTNDIGDGRLGIDFMLKNIYGVWNTVAVTNTEKTNEMCDIKFEFGKKISDCHELIPCSWIYVPKDYHTIYNKIEEFSCKQPAG
ncbi:hypothetical protein [Cytobacillus firmus]